MSSDKNHPRRTKPALPGTPLPVQITDLRSKAGITLEAAAELIWHTPEQMSKFELGERRMHPCTWWAFKQRVAGAA